VTRVATSADLELAEAAARLAGGTVMRYFGRDLVVEHKSPGQPLTEADLAADALIREMLTGARPDYGWLSEETVDGPDRLGRERVWIVDPIDGTRSFIAGRPEFTISIALAEHGRSMVGVVYNPARDELYSAARGGGAWSVMAGGPARPLRVGKGAIRDQLTMLASRSEIAAGEFDPFHGGWRLEPVGSTAYKLARVAAGAGDAFLSRGPKSEWDICAGVLLVEEAGGRVTDLAAGEPRFNRADPYVHGIVASNGALHQALLQRIAELPQGQRLRRNTED
jgi:myo-inositol-1(or 4)-monophosphatase